MKSLFVLRATKAEHYDCPDEGNVHICDRYEDVAFSTQRKKLDAVATNLNSGFRCGYWSKARANELRKLHAGYDDEYTYSVVDVSDFLEDSE